MASWGEFVEREGGIAFRVEQEVFAAPDELSLGPEVWGLWNAYHHDREDCHPFRSLHAAHRRWWVRGTHALSGEQVWIPSCRVSLQLDPGPQPLEPPSSNGLAAHVDPVQARLAATMELLERDATMRAWSTRDGWVQLDFDDAVRRQLRAWSYPGRTDTYYEIPSAAGRTVTCVSVSGGDWPTVLATSACRPSLIAAAFHALAEQHQAHWAWERVATTAQPPAAVRRRMDHFLHWATCPFPPSDLHWLRQTPTRFVSADDAWREMPEASHWPRLVQQLGQQGIQLATVSLDFPPYDTMGMHVVRVVAAKLKPLRFGGGSPPHPFL